MHLEKVYTENSFREIVDGIRDDYEERELRRATVRKVVRIVLFFFIIVSSIVLFYVTYVVAHDVPVNPNDKNVIIFQIDEGMTTQQIEDQLVTSKLVPSIPILKIREKLFQADYKAGSYRLKRSYNTEKIINILSGIEYPE